jgi:hypothetical protein
MRTSTLSLLQPFFLGHALRQSLRILGSIRLQRAAYVVVDETVSRRKVGEEDEEVNDPPVAC